MEALANTLTDEFDPALDGTVLRAITDEDDPSLDDTVILPEDDSDNPPWSLTVEPHLTIPYPSHAWGIRAQPGHPSPAGGTRGHSYCFEILVSKYTHSILLSFSNRFWYKLVFLKCFCSVFTLNLFSKPINFSRKCFSWWLQLDLLVIWCLSCCWN